MATVNYSVPNEIKAEFNRVFASANKSQIVAELMSLAIEDAQRRDRRRQAIRKLLTLRKRSEPVSMRQIVRARQAGRS